MNVLSLFDGISVARVALERAGIPVKKYYSAEIDKFAIQVSTKNHPSIVRVGSVLDINEEKIKSILPEGEHFDLLVGGSPCQDLSSMKKDRRGLEGNKSSLFWEYVRIRDLIKPKYFLLENVNSMPQKDKDTITKAMGVEPIVFNASLVSAQNRKRLFWTNINFELPEDCCFIVKDILQKDEDIDEALIKGGEKPYTISAHYQRILKKNGADKVYRQPMKIGILDNKKYSSGNRVYSVLGTSDCLVTGGTNYYRMWKKIDDVDTETDVIRKLSVIECERLQSLPDNYTEGVSKSQRYKCLGNGFNAEVITQIFKGIV